MTRPFRIEDLERIGAAAQELLAVLGVVTTGRTCPATPDCKDDTLFAVRIRTSNECGLMDSRSHS